MAMARDCGARVVCVTATRGELGTPDPLAWPPERLAAERVGELERSLGILGVAEHQWLGYPDGGCADVPSADAVSRLGRLIEEVAPDTVVTFGPDGFTGHPDHRTVSAWTSAAFECAASPGSRLLHSVSSERRAATWGALNASLGIFPPGYPVVVPDERLAVDLVLEADVVARKVRALAAQTTQTAGLMSALGPECFSAWVGDESFVERS
jgi:LmbE family N-acetylglucosaminyl deacetylase